MHVDCRQENWLTCENVVLLQHYTVSSSSYVGSTAERVTCLLTDFWTTARMKQSDVVTRSRSQRHATNVFDTSTQQQQQQQQFVNQEPARASVLTRRTKRRSAETNEEGHLAESRTQTRTLKKPRNSSLHSGSTTAIQIMTGSEIMVEEQLVETRAGIRSPEKQTQSDLHTRITANDRLMSEEEPEEQLVETKSRTPNAKVSKQTSCETDRTEESQGKCGGGEVTEQPTEAKNRRKRRTEPKRNNPSNERNSEIQTMPASGQSDEQQSGTRKGRRKTKKRRAGDLRTERTSNISGSDEQTERSPRTRTRMFKETRRTGSDAVNMNETQITVGLPESGESEKHLAETQSRKRREKKPIQTCARIESDAKDQNSSATVAGKTSRRGRRTQTTIDGDVKSVCSQNTDDSDAVAQTTSNTDTAVTVSTSSDVAKQMRHSATSSLSEKPELQACRLPVSPSERCSNQLDSDDKEKSNFGEQATSKDAEDDDEAKWHQERRASLPRSIDDAIILPVTCGSRPAELVLNRLESGSRGACVRQSNGSWLTPNEFQLISGRGNAKDWKRSIRHHGHSLKSLTEQGLLSLASPPLCICEHCDVQVRAALSNFRRFKTVITSAKEVMFS